MPAGIQVFNADGIIQIDETYRNFAFRGKGSATCTIAAGGATALRYATVTVTGAAAPMIAIDPGANIISFWRVNVSGTTWTFNFLGPNGASFDYWIFDYFPAPGGSGVGLEVLTPAGDVAFSTAVPPMRISGVSPAPGTVSGLPSGRVYAGIQTAAGFYSYYEPDLGLGDSYPYWAWIYGISKPSATSMSIEPRIFENYFVTSGTASNTSPPPQVVVVDVTHL